MKTNSILKSALLAAGFSAVALIGSAQAQVVNLDVNDASNPVSGTYSGVGAASDTGTYWNALNVGSQTGTSWTASNLKDSNDDAIGTGISFNLNNTPSGAAITAFDAGSAGFAPALLADTAYGQGNTLLGFTFTGLVAGDTYDLFFYAENGHYGSGGGAFTIGSTTLDAKNTAASQSGFVLNNNYVEFVNVAADGSGDIAGTVGYATGYANYINGFQLVNTTETPEPSTLALIGLGGLGLAFLAVRRRHSLV